MCRRLCAALVRALDGRYLRGALPHTSLIMAGCLLPGQEHWPFLASVLKGVNPHKPNSPIVLDVGANQGGVALLSAALGFVTLAFEPLPMNHQRISVMIELNGKAR